MLGSNDYDIRVTSNGYDIRVNESVLHWCYSDVTVLLQSCEQHVVAETRGPVVQEERVTITLLE